MPKPCSYCILGVNLPEQKSCSCNYTQHPSITARSD